MGEKPYKYEWPDKVRPNLTARVPYAYMLDPENPLLMVPNPAIVPAIEKAMEYMNDGHAIRKVTEWLKVATGKEITPHGFLYLWELKCGKDKNNPRVKARRQKKRARAPKTPEEKEQHVIRKQLTSAKYRRTRAATKIEQLEAELQAKLDTAAIEPEEVYYPPFQPFDTVVLPQEYENREIAFTPNPGPQTDFLAAAEREVLYGGAAGGGKSYALLADCMRYFDNPNFRGIILRRTTDELRELIWKSDELYKKIFPGAKWSEKRSAWKFPSGAELWLTYLERDEDVRRYQGQTFCYIAIDELTQYASPFAWDYLRSRLRSVDPTLPLFMRATTNPGGVGHGWVKKMFIDPAPANTPFDAIDIDTGKVLVYPPDYHDKKKRGLPLFKRRFIPARLADNPYLFKGGEYETNLLSLPEAQRRKLLDGDWNIVEGAAFPEFSIGTHVIPPFKIPKGWRRFRSCDYGYNSFSAVHWFAIDPTYETLIVYRELYVTHMTGKQLAQEIKRIELIHDDHAMYGVLDSSVWHQRGQTGPSIAEEMISEGVNWRPGDRSKGSRTNGKNRLHELLKVEKYDDTRQVPGIMFFDTCRQIIADLQVIPADPDGKDDIDDRYASDHAYDSIRYGIMSRPRGKSPWDFENTVIAPSHRPADATFGY